MQYLRGARHAEVEERRARARNRQWCPPVGHFVFRSRWLESMEDGTHPDAWRMTRTELALYAANHLEFYGEAALETTDWIIETFRDELTPLHETARLPLQELLITLALKNADEIPDQIRWACNEYCLPPGFVNDVMEILQNDPSAQPFDPSTHRPASIPAANWDALEAARFRMPAKNAAA